MFQDAFRLFGVFFLTIMISISNDKYLEHMLADINKIPASISSCFEFVYERFYFVST